MGVIRFRLTPPELSEQLPELTRGYFTGLDRTPEAMSLEVRDGFLICRREAPESGRLHVPWPVAGAGMPIVNTATLADRPEPYELAVELARGRLNDVRSQAADWSSLGLQLPMSVHDALAQARRHFSKAAIRPDDPTVAVSEAKVSLEHVFRAGNVLTQAYTDQVLQKRLEHSRKLPTLLACGINGDPDSAPWGSSLTGAINAARLSCSWAELEPVEGQYRWDALDAKIEWCQRHGLLPMAGPLLEFLPKSFPDWLWLWAGDADEIGTMALDLVRQAVARYKGKLGNWHLVGRPATAEVLGLSEEEQIRLAARAIQVAHQIDPVTPLVLDLDRPWAEWISRNFQLGPLHLADSLARAEVGLAGVGLEVAPGYGPPGSHRRDLFDFSRLLDHYALLNQPLYVTIALPSNTEPDSLAPDVSVEARQWPGSIDPTAQRDLAERWVSLAVAKPYVRAVIWHHASDANPHLFPHAGLIGPDGQAKPILDWLRAFRTTTLV